MDSNGYQNQWRENLHIETTQGISDVQEERGIIKASRVGEKKNQTNIKFLISNTGCQKTTQLFFFKFLIFKP